MADTKKSTSVTALADEEKAAKSIKTVSKEYEKYDSSEMEELLKQQADAQAEQYASEIDYATEQAEEALLRNEADANEAFQAQRDELSVSSQRALDNSALYAEARGDRGGIGRAQYDAIQAEAMQGQLAIRQQQTKLATDTARQIADLRAQGEFQKADRLLEVTQTYLSELRELKQWAAEYNLGIDELNERIRQWQYDYNLQVRELNLSTAQWEKDYALKEAQALASSGETLLAAGIMPSAAQLAAMNMSSRQAKSYISAVKAKKAASSSGSRKSGSSKSSSSSGKTLTLAQAQKNAQSGVFNEATLSTLYAYGYSDSDLKLLYPGFKSSVTISGGSPSDALSGYTVTWNKQPTNVQKVSVDALSRQISAYVSQKKYGLAKELLERYEPLLSPAEMSRLMSLVP